jgi:hypothetical protein
MADELTLRIYLSYVDSSTGDEYKWPHSEEFTIDVTGTQWISHVQEIGTSEEAIELGEIATGGYFIAKNLDDTNFVEIRPGTGETDMVKLLPGESCLFRFSGDAAAPYAIADTAAVQLKYFLLEA